MWVRSQKFTTLEDFIMQSISLRLGKSHFSLVSQTQLAKNSLARAITWLSNINATVHWPPHYKTQLKLQPVSRDGNSKSLTIAIGVYWYPSCVPTSTLLNKLMTLVLSWTRRALGSRVSQGIWSSFKKILLVAANTSLVSSVNHILKTNCLISVYSSNLDVWFSCDQLDLINYCKHFATIFMHYESRPQKQTDAEL